jgi:hypothetical protein
VLPSTSKGFDIEIIEARIADASILSILMRAVEMGATWFNDIHVSFRNLLSELGLEHFEQFMTAPPISEAFGCSGRKFKFHKTVQATESQAAQPNSLKP